MFLLRRLIVTCFTLNRIKTTVFLCLQYRKKFNSSAKSFITFSSVHNCTLCFKVYKKLVFRNWNYSIILNKQHHIWTFWTDKYIPVSSNWDSVFIEFSLLITSCEKFQRTHLDQHQACVYWTSVKISFDTCR